jgi:hypothetical protein
MGIRGAYGYVGSYSASSSNASWPSARSVGSGTPTSAERPGAQRGSPHGPAGGTSPARVRLSTLDQLHLPIEAFGFFDGYLGKPSGVVSQKNLTDILATGWKEFSGRFPTHYQGRETAKTYWTVAQLMLSNLKHAKKDGYTKNQLQMISASQSRWHERHQQYRTPHPMSWGPMIG